MINLKTSFIIVYIEPIGIYNKTNNKNDTRNSLNNKKDKLFILQHKKYIFLYIQNV